MRFADLHPLFAEREGSELFSPMSYQSMIYTSFFTLQVTN